MKMTRRFFYGWVVVGACFVALMSTSGAQNTFGLLFKPMLLELGWDRASLSLGMSINMIFYGIGQPVMGKLADRFGPKLVMGVSALVIAGGLSLFGTVTEIWQVYLYYGVISAIGFGGIAPVTVSVVIARWFVRRRGLALSIATTGMAAGQMIVIPASMYLVLAFGWRLTTIWLAVFALIVVLPMAAWVIKANPGDVGAQPDGASAPEPGANDGAQGLGAGLEPRVPLTNALRHRAFWQLSGGFAVCGFTWSLVLTHLVPFALDAGIPEMLTANALGFMSLVSLVFSILIGAMSDKYGRNKLLGVVYLLRGASFLMLPWVGNVPLLLLFALVHGSGRLASVPLTSALTADQFGRPSVGTVFGMILLIHQVGAALGSYLGGFFYDTTGSYFGAFMIAALLGLLAAIASFSIDQKRRPVDRLLARPASL